jgi:hypothetical protein
MQPLYDSPHSPLPLRYESPEIIVPNLSKVASTVANMMFNMLKEAVYSAPVAAVLIAAVILLTGEVGLSLAVVGILGGFAGGVAGYYVAFFCGAGVPYSEIPYILLQSKPGKIKLPETCLGECGTAEPAP